MPAPPAVRTVRLPSVPVSYEVALAQETDLAGEIAAGAVIDIPWLVGAVVLLGILYALRYIIVPIVKLLYPKGGSLLSRIADWAIGTLLAPVKFIVHACTNAIATGIDHHAGRLTVWISSMAFEVHDLTVELGNFATSTASAFHDLRYQTLPREINKVTAPLRSRVTTLENARKLLDAIARQYGYANFPTLVRTATPHIKQLVAADLYVKGQGHASLAGALSVYEATAKDWKRTVVAVQQLGYYTVPDFIRHVEREVTVILPGKIKVVADKEAKLEAKLAPIIKVITPLLALLTVAGFARAFRRIIPDVCTEVGDCAGSNLAGRNNWGIFKTLLNLLLFGAIDALVLTELCTIATGVREVVELGKPGIREIAVVQGGLASIGCAGKTPPLPAPAYS